MRSALPAIIADQSISKSVADTIIGKKKYYRAVFSMDKKVIDRLGGFTSISSERKTIYTVIIDKNLLLPAEVIQTNSENADFTKTVFSNIDLNFRPQEVSWYYSNYLKEYKQTAKKQLTLVQPGSTAIDWSLQQVNGSSIDLKKLKGNVVLLEFWIKNCAHCIEAVAPLNEIYEKYKNKNFRLVAINAYDNKDDVAFFIRKNKPVYMVVLNGERLADKYGVDAFPLIVLIDKNGVVIYSGGIEKLTVERVIEGAL